MTEIYLIRHGVTDNNINGVFQGLTDAELNEQGLKQAECLGERFRNVAVDKIYSSPLKRAVQTAQGANLHKQLPIIPCKGVIEVNGGDMEGKTMEENMRLYADVIDNMRNAPSKFKAPNGESMLEVYDRVSKAMTELARENDGKTIVVVSHGCAIRTFMHYVTGKPADQMGKGSVQNASLSKFLYDSEKDVFSAVYCDDISHIPEELKNHSVKLYMTAGEKE